MTSGSIIHPMNVIFKVASKALCDFALPFWEPDISFDALRSLTVSAKGSHRLVLTKLICTELVLPEDQIPSNASP
jgi:hypothetical protein